MSTVVDERVVQMQFDNKQFESGVSTTLSTLDKLKSALRFDGATKGLEDISSAANRCNLSGLSNAVETVRLKFSALEVMAITTLSNITNSVVNAGKRIASALTIEPVTSGLNEYETQINAVQTILANTSSAQVEVSREAIQEVNNVAEQSTAAAIESNERAMENLKKTQASQLKALNKQAAAESKALQKSQAAQLKAFEKQAAAEQEELQKAHSAQLEEYENRASEELNILKQSHNDQIEEFDNQAEEELDKLEKSHKNQLKEFENRASDELNILEENYDNQIEALEKSIDEETKLLKKSHEEKLDLYHEEYMEKLKATDEDRYREIKAIDDEIDSINNLTKAEDEAREAAEEQKKLEELKNAVYDASTYKEYTKAQEKLAEYEEELSRKKLLKERENRIQELEEQKDAINERYDLINEQIEAEYSDKKDKENELYEEQAASLKEEQSQRKKELKKTYEFEKDLIKDRQKEEKEALQEKLENEKKALRERQEEEREALNERLDSEMTALNERLETERKNISERQNSEMKALSDRQSAEKEALSERQSAERDALSERQEAAREALSDRQEAEMEALSSQHEAALKNIENEKNARIKALSSVQKETKKATTLEDVNKALDELNEYADKTIYNFTEMTRNIGTFTAAGVDLETSVSAIKGIANLAAMSGSSSQQASTAMYQLSQAIAAGKVQLMDWNSVVNAGMGGKVFQDALMETARVHGLAIDEMVASEGSFRETLQNGWLTSDILLETLQKFTGDLTEEELKAIGYTKDQITSIMQLGQTAQDAATKIKTFSQLWDTLKETAQSGWTNTWEIIIGDFDEAKELWTGVYNVLGGIIDRQSDARNAILQGWKEMGGRTVLIEAIKNAFESVTRVVNIFKSVFETIFPPVTSERLYAFTVGLRDLTSHFKLDNQTAMNLAKTFRGLFSAIDVVASIVKGTLRSGLNLLSNLLGSVNIDILGLTASFGDSIYEFRNWIKENDLVTKGLDKLGTVIVTAVEKIREWIGTFVSLPVVQDNLSNFKELLKDVLSDSKEYFAGGIDKISEFIDRIKEMDGISLENIGDVVKDFVDNVVGYFVNFDGAFENVKRVVSDFKDKIKMYFAEAGDIFDGMKQKISSFVESVKEFLGDHLGTAISIGLSAGLLVGIKKIYDAISKISGSAKAFSDFFDAIGDAVKAYGKEKQAKAIYDIAKSIAILVGSIVLLTQLDQESMWSSVAALAILGAGLLGFVAILEKIGKTDTKNLSGFFNKTGFAASIVSMALSLKIAVSAIKDLTKIDTDDLAEAIVSLIGVMIGLGVLASVCSGKTTVKNVGLSNSIWSKIYGMGGSSVSTSSLNGAGTSILAMAVALKVLVSAIDDISNIDTDKIGQNIAAFITIFGMFSILMASSRLAGKNASGAGVMILEMSAALILIVQAVKMISSIDPDEIAKAIITIGALSALASALMIFSAASGNNSAKAGAMILEMSVAMIALSGAMLIISNIDAGGLIKSIAAMITATGMFATLILASSKIKTGNVKTLGVLVVAIGALSLALGALSLIDTATLLGASAALSIVIGMFSLLVASTSLIKKSSGTLIVLTAVVGALAGILYELSGMPIEGGLAASASLSVLLLSLSASILIISNAENISKSAYAALGIMTLITAALAVIIGALAKFNVGPTIEIAASLSVLLLALSESCLILSKTGAISGGAIAGIAKMTAIITAIGGLLTLIGWLMTEFTNGEQFLTKGIGILEQIGLGLGNFAGNIIGGFLDKASEGIVAVGEHLSEFWKKASGFFDGIVNVKPETLTALGTITGVILKLTESDFITGITNFMGTTGKSLSNFATNLPLLGVGIATFSVAVKDVDSDKVTSAANAAKVIAQLQANLPATGGAIQSFFGEKDLSSFTENIAPLGEAIAAFSDKVSNGGVNTEAVTSAANAAKVIAELQANLPDTGGAIQSFFGEKDLSSFTENIAPLGEAIAAFSDKVSNGGVNSEAVASAANAAKVIAQLQANLPATGGVIQKFFGEHDLSSFGNDLSSFGEALSAFSNAVSDGGVNSEAVESAANAAKIIADLESTLPKEQGVLQAFFGEQDLASFAEKLIPFGIALSNYSNVVKNIDPDAIKNSAEAAKGLAELESNLTSSNGVWQIFTGEKSLDNFGANLKSFGEGLANLACSIDDSGIAMIESIISTSRDILDMSDDLAGSSYATNLYNFGSNLSTLGNNIAMFYSSLCTVDLSTLSRIIIQANSLVNMAKNMEDIDSAAMGSFGENLTKIGQNGINGFISEFDGCIDNVKAAIDNMLNALIEHARTYEKSIGSAFYALIDAAVDAMTESYSDFETIGAGTITAFLNAVDETASRDIRGTFERIANDAIAPLLDSGYRFEEAGRTLIGVYLNAVQDGYSGYGTYVFQNIAIQGIETLRWYYDSFYNAGSWVADGFIRGIDSMINTVAIVAHNMAVAALNSAMSVLGIHSPSKEFDKLGRYSDQGFINGLMKMAGKVSSTGEYVGSKAIDGMSNAIDSITNLVDMGDDFGPTIRPIMDLSEIQNGANQIYGIMSRMDGYALSGSYDIASQTIGGIEQRKLNDGLSNMNELKKAIEKLAENPSQNVENVFNITGSDPREIANEVSRRLQAMYERRMVSLG